MIEVGQVVQLRESDGTTTPAIVVAIASTGALTVDTYDARLDNRTR